MCDKVQVQRLTPWPNRLVVEVNCEFKADIAHVSQEIRVLGVSYRV
jgi:hypothetical protein